MLNGNVLLTEINPNQQKNIDGANRNPYNLFVSGAKILRKIFFGKKNKNFTSQGSIKGAL